MAQTRSQRARRRQALASPAQSLQSLAQLDAARGHSFGRFDSPNGDDYGDGDSRHDRSSGPASRGASPAAAPQGTENDGSGDGSGDDHSDDNRRANAHRRQRAPDRRKKIRARVSINGTQFELGRSHEPDAAIERVVRHSDVILETWDTFPTHATRADFVRAIADPLFVPRLPQSSKYKGVCFVRRRNLWRAMITVRKANYFLGDFKTETKARNAFDTVFARLHGDADVIEAVEAIDNREDMRLFLRRLLDPEYPQYCGARKIISKSKGSGVSWFAAAQLWRARFFINKDAIHLGVFAEHDEALEVVARAKANRSLIQEKWNSFSSRSERWEFVRHVATAQKI
ncbi:hypothetical protein HDU84_000925 [Entophlyctis sp. JEL0112]|nr:hypothetical protein HDU84_000925 [Entophlyctis sp. JEL0112]